MSLVLVQLGQLQLEPSGFEHTHCSSNPVVCVPAVALDVAAGDASDVGVVVLTNVPIP